MPKNQPTISAQLATLTELVQQNQTEIKRIAAVQERILEIITPATTELKSVILTPPMSFEYPDAYLKIERRECEAIAEGRSVCIIGNGYIYDCELEAQDYWFFSGGINRGKLRVLMRDVVNDREDERFNPDLWDVAFHGNMAEVDIDQHAQF